MFLERAVPREAREAYRKDAVGGMLAGAFNGAIIPFMLVMAREKLHASELCLGIMTAASAVGSMAALFYANAMEGRKKMPFVVWPGVIGRGLFVLAPFATTPLTFTMMVFSALGLQSIVGPAYAAVLKEIYPDRQRGRIMAYIRVGMAFAAFATTFLVGAMMKGGRIPFLNWSMPKLDYRAIFPIAGLLGAGSSIAFGTIKTAPVDPSHPSNRRGSTLGYLLGTLSILREDRGFAWFLAAIFVSGFGNLIAIPFYPIMQVDVLHITSTWVAILANTATVFAMLAFFYWGKTIDARCPLRATMINVLITACIQLIYFATTKVWMLLPAAMLAGIAASGTELAYFNSILHFAKDGKESQYQALHAFLFGIRGTIAPLLAPVLTGLGVGVRTVFLASALLMVVGALMQMRSMRSDRAMSPQ